MKLGPRFPLLDYGPQANSEQNFAKLAVYLDQLIEGLGLSPANVDTSSLLAVSNSMREVAQPQGGWGQASPFKKAAGFFVWFIACRPFQTPFPSDPFGRLVEIPNHQNVVIAFLVSVDMLDGATLHRKGQETNISERIAVSKHFFLDMVEAFQTATPQDSFKVAALLFEQLVYRRNPTIPYKEEFPGAPENGGAAR